MSNDGDIGYIGGKILRLAKYLENGLSRLKRSTRTAYEQFDDEDEQDEN